MQYQGFKGNRNENLKGTDKEKAQRDMMKLIEDEEEALG